MPPIIVAGGFYRETAAQDLRPNIWHPHRQDELRDLLDTDYDPTPDPQELADLLEQVRAAVQRGPLPVRKTLVDALVEEIRVQSRDHIVPVFRLSNGHHQPDGAVRPGVGWVAPTGFEPALPP
jgi:hypothetical protein